MEFKIHGTRMGQSFWINWKDGELTSNSIYGLTMATSYIEALEGKKVGPTMGPYSYDNHIKNPMAVVNILWTRVFEKVTKEEGEVPRRKIEKYVIY